MIGARELFQTLSERHADLQDGGVALLANVGRIMVDQPSMLIPGLQLRKAKRPEVETFRVLLALTPPAVPLMPTRNPYESACETTTIGPGHTSTASRDLPESEWRYHVFEFSGTNQLVHRFINATMLTPWRIELGFTVVSGTGLGVGFMWGAGTSRVLEQTRSSDDCWLHLNRSELDEQCAVFQKLETHDDEGVGLRAAMQRFEQLDAIPANAVLGFLGYVSILESLITHKPDPKDPYDSLTRQVRQKMLLLERRFAHPLPYAECFGNGADHGAVWSKLYDYRSSIAHGAHADFANRLQILGGTSEAQTFIKAATVATMRHALDEPTLVRDLRAC